MNIDTEDLAQALENFDERVLELGALPLEEIYVRLNATRIRRNLTWTELADKVNARPWGGLSRLERLNLADITNYVVWLAKSSPAD